MRCAIYARVSTEMDSQKGSIANQISYFQHYVQEREWIITDIYKDEGKSGTNIRNRNEIKRMMRDAKEKKFDCVLIKSISRFARDNKDGILMKRQLDELGIRLIFIEQNLDTHKDDEFLFSIHLNLAQQESEQISKRTTFGKQEKARKGKYNGSLPPFGYKRDGSDLVIDEEFSHVVKLIYRLYLQGLGLYKIGKYLDSKKIPTPRQVTGGSNAGDLWLQSSLKIILTNPVYVGDLVQNRSKKINLFSTTRKTVSKKNQIIVKNTHTPIVSRDEFEAVQREMRRRGKYKSNGKESLFTHIAKCGDCGKGMHFKKDRGSYVCGLYSKHGKKYCTSHKIPDDVLFDKVKQQLTNLIYGNVSIDSLANKMKNKSISNNQDYTTELKKINAKVNTLQKQQGKLIELFSEELLTKEEWTIQHNSIKEQILSLNSRKLELQTLINENKDTENNFRIFKKELNKLINLDLDNEDVLKLIIRKLITKIEIFHNEEIKIYYNFNDPNHNAV